MEFPGTSLEARGDVLVLGAGFSRALSQHMPLTDELGNESLTVAGLTGGSNVPREGFRGGNFETWLSRLADEQPYLDAQENLRNRADFLQLSQAIAQVLGERVQQALAEPWPPWLPSLLNVAHERRATLITFNYDTLIECAVAAKMVNEMLPPDEFWWAEILNDVPSWPAGSMRWAGSRIETFRLLKLHGSLNWYWTTDDASGASVARRDLPGKYGAPSRYTEDDRQRELPGRVPFVVPPAAAKSPYYRNPIVRDVWQQAATALRAASRIVLLGYSIPVTDLTFSGLLVDAVTSTNVPVVVVDTHPDGVVERLVALGIDRDRLTKVGGTSPVADFAAAWLRDQTRDLRAAVRERAASAEQATLAVAWDSALCLPVDSIAAEPGKVVLSSVLLAPPGSRPTLGDLLSLSGEDDQWVYRRNDAEQPISGWRTTRMRSEHSISPNVFLSAGYRPSP